MTPIAIWCFIICFGSQEAPEVLKGDYCTLYKRQIISVADTEAAKKLPRDLKERLAFNELAHRCLCDQTWAADPRCKKG